VVHERRGCSDVARAGSVCLADRLRDRPAGAGSDRVHGTARLKQRVGTLDPKKLAKLDLQPAFREKPAIHRFPGTMAQRVQELAQYVVDEYGGEASRIWTDAADGDDLKRRIEALPGYGEMKVKSLSAVLAKHFGVRQAAAIAPSHPTLGDVDSLEKLNEYQSWKREYKRSR
jgi:uncharacterized HhH-GPD family protein